MQREVGRLEGGRDGDDGSDESAKEEALARSDRWSLSVVVAECTGETLRQVGGLGAGGVRVRSSTFAPSPENCNTVHVRYTPVYGIHSCVRLWKRSVWHAWGTLYYHLVLVARRWC